MSELVEFLLARIAEDEARAEGSGLLGWARITYEDGTLAHTAAVGATVDVPDEWALDGQELGSRYAVAAYHDERRVIAECAAKRAIIEARYDPRDIPGGYGDGWTSAWEHMILIMAQVYADHPDFREEWRQ